MDSSAALLDTDAKRTLQPAQPRMPPSTDFALKTERPGPLPLINHFIGRIGLEALLEQHVPTTDRRCTLAHARALGVLLRSIIVEREPIYHWDMDIPVSWCNAAHKGQLEHADGVACMRQ
jgi:hypothetical protein